MGALVARISVGNLPKVGGIDSCLNGVANQRAEISAGTRARFSVRVKITRAKLNLYQVDGEPWFVAKDVCDILELGRQQDSTRYLDEDEKRECLVNTPSGKQSMVSVNEPGLYSLIIRSRKPEAKAFKRWITHEVLPTIRKTGSYATNTAQASLKTATGLLELDKVPGRPFLGAKGGSVSLPSSR